MILTGISFNPKFRNYILYDTILRHRIVSVENEHQLPIMPIAFHSVSIMAGPGNFVSVLLGAVTTVH